MTGYDNWTVEVKEDVLLRLIIDGKDILESVPVEKKDGIQGITKIYPVTDDLNVIKIFLGNVTINLIKNKFLKTTLFGKNIKNTEDLLTFWNDVSGFLREDNLDNELNGDDTHSNTKQDKPEMHIVSEEEETIDTQENGDDDQLPENLGMSSFKRAQLMESISNKKIDYRYLDIFTLFDPPMKYRVRDTNQEFIEKLAEVMISKKSISLHNAPNIIGLIDQPKADYKEEDFPLYKVYIIDGNHSIKAQKLAYKKTNNPMFKYRGVNLYCGLTEDEALLLGISRNEDTEQFVKFSDFQKVEVLRRRLYTMTCTPDGCEPPEPPKSFKDVFASLLNLQTKKAIDSKSSLKYLATSLSNRCFELYREISSKGKYPASKYDGLKGLSEEDTYAVLKQLASTSLERDAWQNFNMSCQKKQKRPRKLRKDVTVTFKFNQKSTEGYVGQKPMNGNVACFRFQKDDFELVLSAADFQNYILDFKYSEKNEAELKQSKRFKKCKRKISVSDSLSSESESTGSRSSKMKHLPTKASHSNTSTILSPSKLKPNILKRNIISVPLEQYSNEQCAINSNTNTSTCVPLEQYSNGESAINSNNTSTCSSNNISSMHTEDANVSMSDVSLFLHKMADSAAVYRSQQRHCPIEEDEVETKPEKLMDWASVLLSHSVQKAAKQFFSADAWECVHSTLTILEERYVKNVQQYLDAECCTNETMGKGKGLIGAKQGRIFHGGRKEAKGKIKSYMNKFLQECASTPKKFQETGRRNVYSFCSDDLSPIKTFQETSTDVFERPAQRGREEDNNDEKPERQTGDDGSSLAGRSIERKNRLKRCRVRLTDVSTVKNLKDYETKCKKKINVCF